MVISIESKVPQPNSGKQVLEGNRAENENLKELFVDVLKNKNEYVEDQINWQNNETVSVSNVSSMALHSFVLEAEKLGKNITYTKKTVIEIS